MPAHALHLVHLGARHENQHDGLLHLAKNLNIHPDVLIGEGTEIAAFGVPGSGKTTLMALLLEQFGECSVPFSVFDLEGDLKSLVPLLPRGVLGTADNCPTVHDMYKGGLQVIFDLDTFGEDRNCAARFISQTVSDLLALTKSLPQGRRVPFLIGLDEAAYWLPQIRTGKDYLLSSQFEALFSAFHTLAIRGRKMGLVPMLFAQRIANLHKDVLSPGTYILMRQTTDTDLKRYMEYISPAAFGDDEMTAKQMRSRIATFKKGQAVVKLTSGKQGLVQFYNRESEHSSHAPKIQAAQNLYRDVPFDPHMQYGAANLEEQAPPPVVSSVPSNMNCKFCGKGLPAEIRGSRSREYCNDACRQANYRANHRGDKEQTLRSLLAENPNSTISQMQLRTGYARSDVERIVACIQADEESETADVTHQDVSRQNNTKAAIADIKRQIFSLLDADPNLSLSALVAATGYAFSTVRRHATEYFAQHPERRGKLRQKSLPSSTIKAQVFEILSSNPTLTPTALATQTGHPVETTQKYRQEYFALHPEKKSEKQTSKLELSMRALLAENPGLTVGQIKYRTGYSQGEIKRMLACIQGETSGGEQ